MIIRKGMITALLAIMLVLCGFALISVSAETDEEIGHLWDSATCEEPKTCRLCGLTEGEPKGHAWVEATCSAPRLCADCAVFDGEAKGHVWTGGTCTEAAICSVCSRTDESTLGHKYDNACDTECNTCKEQRQVGAHKDANEDCFCDICGTELESLGLPSGAIAGIIAAVVVLVFGIGASGFLVSKRKKQERKNEKNS